MKGPAKGYGSHGPHPWQQTSWDARAAGNFIGGGMGGSLIVFTALFAATGPALSALLLAGLGLVGLGLLCVASELGRPLRAIRVLRNPRTSWMARESWTALLLFPVGLIAAAGVADIAWIASALALVFVYCQARMLQAAKGIPAWREPLLLPLLVTTALAEGGGVFLLTAPFHHFATGATVILFSALVVARFVIWVAYRRRLGGSAAPGARTALDAAGRVLMFAGTLLPLVLAAAAAFAGGLALPIAALAGLLAALAGAWVKLLIVTRAGFNQGFALAHLPVRGVRP
ncbi:MAG TPA: phenylacetyl-CoA:acceptor oxidoreductase [Casimicrobiaceae bacterium]|jgi:phenylacetyl-CoA:acceptor oxidoreductase subunit 2